MQAIARQERGWGTSNYSDPRHNPGDIEDGEFAQAHGALPPDGHRFAAWATEEEGFAAMRALLKEHYQGLTVFQAILKWAPAVENDDSTYVKHVCSWTGLLPSTFLTPELIG
jgi:hypothetical protein